MTSKFTGVAYGGVELLISVSAGATVVNARTSTADGKEVETSAWSKRNPEDRFDANTGADIATARALRNLADKLERPYRKLLAKGPDGDMAEPEPSYPDGTKAYPVPGGFYDGSSVRYWDKEDGDWYANGNFRLGSSNFSQANGGDAEVKRQVDAGKLRIELPPFTEPKPTAAFVVGTRIGKTDKHPNAKLQPDLTWVRREDGWKVSYSRIEWPSTDFAGGDQVVQRYLDDDMVKFVSALDAEA